MVQKLSIYLPSIQNKEICEVKIYTPDEVADLLSIQPATVRAYARAGLLRGRKLGNLWRFTEKAVADFMEGGPCPSEENQTVSGSPMYTRQAANEYENLVARGTKPKRANGTRSS